ncbi:hypothetical protein RRG08_015272 [Elysia crispata]|uniref:Uncharacterized protein n=1 Tax=Elysia crispata TaxID=231223 RepID=A0AAE1ASU5_9GAST|nr:hypothetical protein RRG08_015272 [Elysia crispata]
MRPPGTISNEMGSFRFAKEGFALGTEVALCATFEVSFALPIRQSRPDHRFIRPPGAKPPWDNTPDR